MTVKTYKPGDPEFEAIAKTVKNIRLVHKESHPRTYIDAEPDRSARNINSRRESVDESRG